MKTILGLENLKRFDKKSVVTIGVFDGVHIGHQKIIKTAVIKAKESDLYSAVVTFDPHPLDVLRPKAYATTLTSVALKLHLIESLGVDLVLVINFTKSFAKMSAKRFIKDILIDKLWADHIIIGQGFRFGAGARGNVEYLRRAGQEYGFSVEEIPLVKTEDNLKISSTRIRNLIKEGKLGQAQKILGHPVIISGKVISGKGFGSLTGFHTANIETGDKASVPQEGVYAGFTRMNNKRLPCVLNIGPSPTFDIRKKRIEVHILKYNRPLYDQELEVELIARLRGIKKFKDAAHLSNQIKKDIEKAKAILAKV